MSSSTLGTPLHEGTRRGLTPRQRETVDALVRATRQELRRVGWDGLTVRSAAARADVAPATAYTYFASKAHLVAETYWRTLVARSITDLPDAAAVDRVVHVIRELGILFAEEPDLAAAATPALLGPHPEVEALRTLIGATYHARFRDALGTDASPDLLRTLDLTFSGAMLHAGMGYVTYEQMTEDLVAAVHVMLGTGQ